MVYRSVNITVCNYFSHYRYYYLLVYDYTPWFFPTVVHVYVVLCSPVGMECMVWLFYVATGSGGMDNRASTGGRDVFCSVICTDMILSRSKRFQRFWGQTSCYLSTDG